ncbi:hypothetical protein LSCM1_00862 [Leishmania martiniquensis]|uniref:Uncharacterized protein n=1 Tax=Leishmania martiniquensis TaxID=1580590 RepID=A0A836FPK7_9TRYP|nr:hypothetical protein LSCM1_00862 [Leishmania martiniquensis]
MPPPRSVSMKRLTAHVDAGHEKVAASPRETESMALTTATTAPSTSRHCSISTRSSKGHGSTVAAHGASTITSPMSAPSPPSMTTAKSPSLDNVVTSAIGGRKRARSWTEHSSRSDSRDGRSPSASVATGNVARPPQRSRPSGPFGSDNGRISGTPQLGRGAKTHAEEVVFEATATKDSPSHLQRTPTSQLLSQRQAPPYSALAEDRCVTPQEPALEQALFTPATVARRPQPQAAIGKAIPSSALSVASAANSASPAASSTSRPSSHDEAVQAILRANPPTTTRPVQLKPGYKVPSPQSPLWAALEDDRDEDDYAARDSGPGLEEPLLSSTQISLFQLGDEEETSTSGAARTTALAGLPPSSVQTSATTAATVPTEGAHVPTTMHECRRLAMGAAANKSISLPAPGRSLNLLDEDGLHDDERLPLFVEMGGDSQGDDADGESFSLTQEANRQDREQDVQAILPRSRARRGAASAAATRPSVTAILHPSKFNSANMSTPSPARQRAARTSLSAPQQQASPYSQLQRDMESTMAAGAAASERQATAPAAGMKPPRVLSQKELRRRADMLKWAERTRAFFHFIDTRPLQVTSSPLKPLAATLTQSRRGTCSESVVVGAHRRSIGGAHPRKSPTVEASVSLVRRSHSASTAAASPHPSVATHSSSSAFEAVISRVRREAAAAAANATRRASAK